MSFHDRPPGFLYAEDLEEPDDFTRREDLIRDHGYTAGWLGQAYLQGLLRWTTEGQLAARWPERTWKPGVYFYSRELAVARAIESLGGAVAQVTASPRGVATRYGDRPTTPCPACGAAASIPGIGASVCPACSHVFTAKTS